MIEDILQIVQGVGTVASTAKDVIALIQETKKLLKASTQTPLQSAPPPHPGNTMTMQAFHAQMPDPYQGGTQWIPQLQNLAQHTGNSWVPPQTEGILGINLTGIWCPPGNFMDQTYIRQYGTYLNLIAGIGGTPTLYGEGLLNPQNGALFFVGRNLMGASTSFQGQLFPQWIIQGSLQVQNFFGIAVPLPILIGKIAG
jgi:hypothetical protein